MSQYGGLKEQPSWYYAPQTKGVSLTVSEYGPVQLSPEQKRQPLQVWDREIEHLSEDVAVIGRVLRGIDPHLGSLQPRIKESLKQWDIEFVDHRLGREIQGVEAYHWRGNARPSEHYSIMRYEKDTVTGRNRLSINRTHIYDPLSDRIRPRNGYEERLIWPSIIGHELGHAQHINLRLVLNEEQQVTPRSIQIWRNLSPYWIVEGMALARQTSWRRVGETYIPGTMPVLFDLLSSLNTHPLGIKTLLRHAAYATRTATPNELEAEGIFMGSGLTALSEILFLSVLGFRLGRGPNQLARDWREIGQSQRISQAELAQMTALDVHKRVAKVNIFRHYGDEIAKMMFDEWSVTQMITPYLDRYFPEGDFGVDSLKLAKELHAATPFGLMGKTFVELLAQADIEEVLRYGELLTAGLLRDISSYQIQNPMRRYVWMLSSVIQSNHSQRQRKSRAQSS